jgi:hypothetical protein
MAKEDADRAKRAKLSAAQIAKEERALVMKIGAVSGVVAFVLGLVAGYFGKKGG